MNNLKHEYVYIKTRYCLLILFHTQKFSISQSNSDLKGSSNICSFLPVTQMCYRQRNLCISANKAHRVTRSIFVISFKAWNTQGTYTFIDSIANLTCVFRPAYEKLQSLCCFIGVYERKVVYSYIESGIQTQDRSKVTSIAVIKITKISQTRPVTGTQKNKCKAQKLKTLKKIWNVTRWNSRRMKRNKLKFIGPLLLSTRTYMQWTQDLYLCKGKNIRSPYSALLPPYLEKGCGS